MPVLLVLLSSRAEARLSSDALSTLRRLGVTHVALLRDDQTVGVVVEGWAFDPVRSAKAVIAALSGESARARTLTPLMEMTLSRGDE